MSCGIRSRIQRTFYIANLVGEELYQGLPEMQIESIMISLYLPTYADDTATSTRKHDSSPTHVLVHGKLLHFPEEENPRMDSFVIG